MPKAPPKKPTTQKAGRPTPAVGARRRGHGVAEPQENATGGALDDPSSTAGPKTVSRRSSRLQPLPTDVAATATTSTHPTPTVAPSQAPKRKRGSGASKKKNPPPIQPQPESPIHRTTPPISRTTDTHLSPPAEEDEEDTGRTLPNSKEGAHLSGTTDIDQGEDTDELPPPPKRRIATDPSRSRATVSRAGSSNSTNGTQLHPATSVRLENESSSARIRELEKELEHEREKNRLLRKSTTKDKPAPKKLIPRPKGSVGGKGFQLMAEMGLDKTNVKEKLLYNNILATVRTLMFKAGIDFNLTYKQQSMTKMAKLLAAAREEEPYLARFDNDWATGQIIQQCINGRRKSETKKSRRANAGGGESADEDDDSEDNRGEGSERDHPEPYSENHGALTWGNEELDEEEYNRRLQASGLYMMDD